MSPVPSPSVSSRAHPSHISQCLFLLTHEERCPALSSRSFHWSWLRFFHSHSLALSSAVFVPLAKDGGRRTHSSQFAVGWSRLLQCLQHCRVQMAVIETILLLDFCQYSLLLSDDRHGTSLDASHRPLRVVIQLFYGTSDRSHNAVFPSCRASSLQS